MYKLYESNFLPKNSKFLIREFVLLKKSSSAIKKANTPTLHSNQYTHHPTQNLKVINVFVFVLNCTDIGSDCQVTYITA